MIKKIVLGIIILGVTFTILLQLVPYGRNHTNPPIVQEPQWDTPQTRALVSRACFDCHSNETVWPWYTNVAPASWLVYRDVAEGRDHVNFSEWPAVGGGGLMAQAAQMVSEGEMPPLQYRLAHSAARLSDAQKQQLSEGLRASAQ